MSNLNISQFPAVTSADNSADLLLLWQGGTSTTKSISKLNYLGLSSVAVGINDSQTLTNKTITSPTISGPTLSGTITGTYTIGGTPTFPSSVVTLTGSQTLTNKILTSPTINTATISNPTLTVDTINGFTTGTNVTAGGVTLQNGAVGGTSGTFSTTLSVTGASTLTGAVSAGGAVTSAGLLTASNGFTLSGGTLTLPNNSITGAMLATSTIGLGYTQITSNFTTSTTGAWVDVTSLAATVTVPAGGRNLKITAYIGSIRTSAVAGTTINMGILESSTVLGSTIINEPVSAYNCTGMCVAYVAAPSAGSHTYKVSVGQSAAGTVTVAASTANPSFGTNSPAFILVELI